MKKIIFSLGLISASFLADAGTQPINPVLGDASFIETFGTAPTTETGNTLRIKTHLQYVENLLRAVCTDNLTTEQKASRENMLDLLHEYWTAEVFPLNYDYAERKPCFIDKNNTICAVGYLVQQTAGQHVAEKINSVYQYAYISEMELPELNEWINNSGLTKTECAMIQPTYEPYLINATYADGGAEGFCAYLSKEIKLDSNTIDSADVSFTVDKKGKPKNIVVKAAAVISALLLKAIQKAVFTPGHYQGWNANPEAKVETDLKFKTVFNLPADSVYRPQILDCKNMTSMLKPDTSKTEAKIYCELKNNKNDAYNLQGLQIFINGKQVNYTYPKTNTICITALKTDMSSGSAVTIEMKATYSRTVILKNVPFNDQSFLIPLYYLQKPEIGYGKNYYQGNPTRLAINTSV